MKTKKDATKTFLLAIGLFCVLLLSVATACFFFRTTLLGFFIEKTLVILEQESEIHATFAGAQWKQVEKIHVYGIELEKPVPQAPVLKGAIAAIELNLSFASLFQGLQAFAQDAQVNITAPSLNISWPDEQPASSPQKDEAFTLAPNLPSYLPKMVVTDGRISVRHPDAVVYGENMHLSFSPSCQQEDYHEACLKVENSQLQITAGERFEEELVVAGTVYYGDGTLRIPALSMTESAGFTDITISGDNQQANFEGKLLSRHETISFSGKYGARVVSLAFKSEAFSIENIPDFLPDLAKKSSGKMVTSGSILLPLDHIEQTNGLFDLLLTDGSYGKAKIDRLLLQAEAKDGVLSCPTLIVETPGNTVSLHNLRLNLENLAAKQWEPLLQKAEVGITAHISTPGDLQHLLPSRARDVLARIGLTGATIAASFQHNTFDAKSIAVRAKAGETSFEEVSISLYPGVSDWRHWPIAIGHFSLDVSEISTLESFFSQLPPVTGQVIVEGRGKGHFLEFEGSGILKTNDVNIAGIQLSRLQGDFVARPGALQVSVDSATENGDLLSLKTTLQLKEERVESLTAQILINDLGAYSPFVSLPFPIQGALQTNIEGSGSFMEPSGKVEIHGRDILLDTYPLTLLQATISRSGKIVRLEEAKAISGDKQCIVSATAIPAHDWRSAEIDIDRLRFNLQGKEIKLVETSGIFLSTSQIKTKEEFAFQTDDALFTFSGSRSSDVYEGYLEAEIYSGEWLSTLFFKQGTSFKTAKLKASLQGTLADPVIQLLGNVTGLGTALSEIEFSGTWDAAYQNEKVSITHFELDGGTLAKARLSGVIPYSFKEKKLDKTKKDLFLSSNFNIPDAALISQIFPNIFSDIDSASGSIDVQGSLLRPSGIVNLQVQGFSLAPVLGPWIPPGKSKVDCQTEFTEGEIQFKNCALISSIGDIQVFGSIGSETSLIDLLPLTPEHPVGQMDIQGKIKVHDISWVASRVEALRRLSGEALGTFALTGPPAAPILSGEIVFEKGEIRLSPTLPALREVYFMAKIDQNSAELLNLRGLLGGSPFNGSGQYRFGRGEKEKIDMKLQGSNLLFHRGDGIRVRGDAKFRMQGDPNKPVIDGKIFLTDCRYTKPVDFLSIFNTNRLKDSGPKEQQFLAFHEPPLKEARLNIETRAKTPCSIKNNIIKGYLRPELSLGGTGETLSLLGNVYVDGLQLSAPSGRINFDSGSFYYLPEKPGILQINMTGKSRMMGYDIDVQVTGSIDEPVINLSSSPPLSNEDLLMLLLMGRKPEQQNLNNQGRQKRMTNVAVYIGKGLLGQWFPADNSDKNDVLDRLQLDIGRSVTQTGEDTMEAQFLLKENMLTGNDELYITGERDVWDDFNGGLRFVFRFD